MLVLRTHYYYLLVFFIMFNFFVLLYHSHLWWEYNTFITYYMVNWGLKQYGTDGWFRKVCSLSQPQWNYIYSRFLDCEAFVLGISLPLESVHIWQYIKVSETTNIEGGFQDKLSTLKVHLHRISPHTWISTQTFTYKNGQF